MESMAEPVRRSENKEISTGKKCFLSYMEYFSLEQRHGLV